MTQNMDLACKNNKMSLLSEIESSETWFRKGLKVLEEIWNYFFFKSKLNVRRNVKKNDDALQ